MLKLVQVRRCDGECCRESPRFPNADHTDCIYHDTAGGKENLGCMLMRGDATIGRVDSVRLANKTAQQVYQDTCIDWPQKNSVPDRGDTGGCCWQWVE